MPSAPYSILTRPPQEAIIIERGLCIRVLLSALGMRLGPERRWDRSLST